MAYVGASPATVVERREPDREPAPRTAASGAGRTGPHDGAADSSAPTSDPTANAVVSSPNARAPAWKTLRRHQRGGDLEVQAEGAHGAR